MLLFVVKAAEVAELRQREAALAKARRMLFRVNDQAVPAPPLNGKVFHLFLSHVWGTGQDQVRIIKQRLREMIPDLFVFLDVDDLEDISNLDSYIDQAQSVLKLCTRGYFQSKNCMIELRAAVVKGKPIITLMEPESKHGGLTKDEIKLHLSECETLWNGWGFKDGPSGEMLFEALFSQAPVQWERIGAFQDVSMRLIAIRGSRVLNSPGRAR